MDLLYQQYISHSCPQEMELNVRKTWCLWYLFHVGLPTRQILLDRFFFFSPTSTAQHVKSFFSYDVTPLPGCQNPWKQLCSVPACCYILLLRNQWIWTNLTKPRRLLQSPSSAIHFEKKVYPFFFQTSIWLTRDMQCKQGRRTRSRISHSHCIPDAFCRSTSELHQEPL